MNKHMKILSLMLALVMILSSVPIALADSYPGIFPQGATAFNGEEDEETSKNIDVSGASNYLGAINVYAANGGTATHEVTGYLNSNMVTAQVISRETNDEYGDAEATLNVGGDVTVTTRESGYPNKDAAVVAVNVESTSSSEGNADASVTVGGEVAATDPYGKTRMEKIDKWTTNYYEGIPVIGVQADASSLDAGDAAITVTAENSVTAEGKGEDEVTGVFATADSENGGKAQAVVNVAQDVSATADQDQANGVEAAAKSKDKSEAEAAVTVGGDLTATSDEAATGADLTAEAYGGKASASLDVSGSITAESLDGYFSASGADVYAYAEEGADSEAQAALTVGGDVTASAAGEYSQASGLEMWAVSYEDTKGALATADVTGDITATVAGAATDAVGIRAGVSGEEGIETKIAVTVGGSITAKATDDQGESPRGTLLSAAVVEEDGEAEAESSDEGDSYYRKESDADGILAYTMEGTISIQVAGTISAEADSEAVGINLGDSRWSETNGAEGEGALIEVSAKGVSAKAGEKGSALGAYLSAAHDGTVNAEIGEEGITAEGGNRTAGTEINIYDGGTVTLSVAGNINTSGALDAYGVEVWAFDEAEITVDVDGAVTASAEGEAIGIEAISKGENTSVEITAGSIEATGEYASGAVLMAGDNGTISLTVNGDVTGDSMGLGLTCGDDTGKIDVIVDGVLSGGDAAIMLQGDDTVIGENVSVAVWKMEAGEDAPLVVNYDVHPVDYSDQDGDAEVDVPASVYVQNEVAEKAVQYIVKVMDAWASALTYGNITSSGEVIVGSGEDAKKYHTALQDEDVKLKVTLAENEALAGIYYDEETLLDNVATAEDGSFLVKMLRGGGMMLGLKTLKLTAYPAKEPTCSAGGNTAYWYSPDLNKYYSDTNGINEIEKDSWVLAPTGKHKNLTAYPAKEPTCSANGNTAYWYCEDCNKYFSDAEGQNEIEKDSWVLPATGDHSLTAVPAKEATETEAGNSAYWYCQDCNKYFSDAEGLNEIAPGSWVIPAKGVPVTTILKIRDKSEKTEIEFKSNGTYTVTYEDGSTEKGKFRLADGKIVLVNDDDAEKTEMPITRNEETGKFDLTYQSSKDAEKTFDFEIEEADVDLLIQNRA